MSAKNEYHHWSVEHATADDLEVALNSLQYEGYEVVKVLHLGARETNDAPYEDTMLVVAKTHLGKGETAKAELRAILEVSDEADEYDFDDEDRDDNIDDD